MDQELADLLARLAELTDDELADLRTRLDDEANRLLDGDADDDDTIAALEAVSEGIAAAKAEQQGRKAAREERAAKKAALADKIKGLAGEDEDEGGEEEDGEGTADDKATEDEKAPAGVAASATEDTPKAPVVSKVAARRPEAAKPKPAVTAADFVLTASANVPGIPMGARLDNNPDMLAQAFLAVADGTRGYRGRDRVKVPFATARLADPLYEQGGERFLGRDARTNEQRIHAGQRAFVDAVVASGGICAPQQVNYDMPTLGVSSRPFRDGLVRFGADRGGIRTLPPPLLTDVDDAISVWDHDTDLDPDGATKPCLTLTCPDEDETLVEAIVRCLEVGNFRARFFPEQVQAWLDLAAVAHARFAEQRLIATVAAGSVATTAQELLGTTPNLLAVLDRAIAGYRGRHRDPNIRLRWAVPHWLIDNMKTDFARSMPVGTVDETMAIAEATITRFFTSRGVSITTMLEGEAGQTMSTPQGAGSINPWPDSAVTYLWPDGDWLFLDGGQLDLGLVRDSTLNSTNDTQIFMETFEGAHHHGAAESLRISVDVCPDGKRGALATIDPCTTGS